MFTNNISNKRMHTSEVKPGGKDEWKRIIQNALSDSPAKKKTFQTLLEFLGGGGSSRMMCLAILKTWKKILDLDLAIPNLLEESESTVD